MPVERNAKGTALFALAALAQFRQRRSKAAATEASELLRSLLAARLDGWSGAAWGYNFDWQGRAFYVTRGTPTIVPTAFAVRALIEAAEAFDDPTYAAAAQSASRFILQDLHRSVDTGDELCFSYSPLDRTRVLNASLLAAETLAAVGRLTGEQPLLEMSLRAARYVVRHQRPDGSWAYGAEGYQSWTDNFHTAFVLTSLARIIAACDAQDEFMDSLRLGYRFWRNSFFLADGWPKYYHDRLFPADAHAAGAAIVTLLDVRRADAEATGSAFELAERVASWAVRELRDERGFFYYQRRRFYTVRTPYMRWAQGWMLYGLARLMEEKSGVRNQETEEKP